MHNIHHYGYHSDGHYITFKILEVENCNQVGYHTDGHYMKIDILGITLMHITFLKIPEGL